VPVSVIVETSFLIERHLGPAKPLTRPNPHPEQEPRERGPSIEMDQTQGAGHRSSRSRPPGHAPWR
jgi:hypothetical protein